MHADEPWWGRKWRYRERFHKLKGEIARSFFLERGLKFFPFIVAIGEASNV